MRLLLKPLEWLAAAVCVWLLIFLWREERDDESDY